jgi:hypothetical protein
MKYLLLIFIILSIVSLYVFTNISIYKEIKQGNKFNPVWLWVVFFLPLLGPVIYLFSKKRL